MENTPKENKDYLLPASIVIAALLIAGAWIYTAGLKNIEQKKSGQAPQAGETAPNIENVIPISNDDHIRGDKNAPIQIVEFSDMECPYCKNFHQTMLKIMEEYGENDQVAWVYRHFPLEQLHPLAQKAAEASECAAKIGGNDIFWEYLDQYMALSSSEENLTSNKFTKIAENVGLNKTQFENCLNSGEFKEKINGYAQDAMNSGAQGTPYSVIIGKNNKKYEINGALPIDDFKDRYGIMQKGIKTLIEEALK